MFINDVSDVFIDPEYGNNEDCHFLTVPRLVKKICNLGPKIELMRSYLGRLRSMPNHKYNLLIQSMLKLDVAWIKCKTQAYLVKYRIEPVVIWMKGPPGMGKSCIMDFLPQAVYQHVQQALPDYFPDKWDAQTMNFDKPETSDYWEGYRPLYTFCLRSDEFMGQEDPTLRGAEGVVFNKLVSEMNYTLNYGDLKNKGCNSFCSPLIIVSTNISDHTIKAESGMTEPNSVFRRRHIQLEISQKAIVDDVIDDRNEAWDLTMRYDPGMDSYMTKARAGTPSHSGGRPSGFERDIGGEGRRNQGLRLSSIPVITPA
jgi:hypothetical protein